MCTVLLPPGGNPIAVNKYIIYQWWNNGERGKMDLLGVTPVPMPLSTTIPHRHALDRIWTKYLKDFWLKMQMSYSYNNNNHILHYGNDKLICIYLPLCLLPE